MTKCPLLSTLDEDVECFKECSLYKWAENNNKCPFLEFKSKRRRQTIKYIYDYEFFKEDKTSPISILYNNEKFY